MNIAILETGLFPDAETVSDAVSHLTPLYNVYRYNLQDPKRSEEDWDQLLDEVLASDRVFTL
ncbi:MAG: hypothetical protein P8009_07385 [Gammaproteobacteria bacterium]|nr:hypothetical protein [Gammaproteobacteria bacterium]